MVSLTKGEKARVKVCFVTLVFALLMQRAGAQLGLNDGEMPVLSHCTTLIDELLADIQDDGTKQEVIARIQKHRVKFSRKVRDIDAGCGLIATVRYFIGPTFKSKPGTRFDYIRGNLRTSIEVYERVVSFSESEVKSFTDHLSKAVKDI